MENFIIKIIPIVLFFALGYILKRVGVFEAKDGSVLLKLVFYLSMPALTYTSLMETRLTADLLYLPFIPVITMLMTWIMAKILLRIKPQNRKTEGTFLLGSMIMNTGFTLPFFMAGYGADGFTKAILFDIGNSFLIFTWVYFIAVKAGAKPGVSRKDMLFKSLMLPPLWALIIALICKQMTVQLPASATMFLDASGQLTIPLIMLSLGLYFEPVVFRLFKALSVLGIRMIGGMLVGLLIVQFIPVDPVTRIVIIASSGAPVGYNTLIFSTMEDLDKDFAASIVSMAILTGILLVPLMFFLFS